MEESELEAARLVKQVRSQREGSAMVQDQLEERATQVSRGWGCMSILLDGHLVDRTLLFS